MSEWTYGRFVSQLTLSRFPFAVGGGCAARDATSGADALAVARLSKAFELFVFGPEGASPLPAELLVVDAVSSMGDGPPTDCASFTTSWVICSAITICGSAVAAGGSVSEACSLGGKDMGGSGSGRGRMRPAAHVGKGRKSKVVT